MKQLKYIHIKRSKGRVYYDFRKGQFRCRLPGKPGSPEFIKRYAELLTEQTRPTLQTDTFGGLCIEYQQSYEFKSLRATTQKEYRRVIGKLEPMIKAETPIKYITRQVGLAIRDKHLGTPRTAKYYLQVLNVLLGFAVDRAILSENPCAGIRMPSSKARREFWGREEIQLILDNADETVRTGFLMALYTGQRRNDIISCMWSQYDGRAFKFKQSKTGVTVHVPCAEPLRQHLNGLDRKNCTHLLTDKSNQPISTNAFRLRFERLKAELGIEGLQFRDLRRTAVIMLAEAGCSVPEIAAITGHTINQTQKIIDTYWVATRKQSENAIVLLDEYIKKSVQPEQNKRTTQL